MTDRKTGRFGVLINEGLCKRCGICAAFCPAECLARDEMGKIIVADETKCIGCRLCMIRCPDMAIEVTDKDKVSK